MSAVAINTPPSKNDMVGLDALMEIISSIKTGAGFRNMAASYGATLTTGFQNALIVGPQGTGKTTFAKMLAFEYRATGIIAKDAPILFTDAVSLNSEYIGQSEANTKELLHSITDGVIIIDEIDSLLDISRHGPSVLNTLNAHMGNAVNAPIIVATCYASRHEELLWSNPGLGGRFRHTLHMPQYDIDDLADMFVKRVHRSGLMCANDVRSSVKELLTQVKKSKGSLFANAREVQNIFDIAVDTHAARLTKQGFDFSQYTERQ